MRPTELAISVVLTRAALAPELPGSRFSMHGVWVGTRPGARRAGLGRALKVSLEKWPAFHQRILEAPFLLPDKFCRVESDQAAMRIRSKQGIRFWVSRSRVRHAHLPPNRKTAFLNQKHSILPPHSNRTGLVRGGVSSAAVRSRCGTVVTSANSAQRKFDLVP